MTGFPEMVVSTSPAMPYTAMHSAAGEPFIVPSQAKNVAGGKEILRTMLSKEAATNFAKTKLAPTIVKGTVPADGFGSTALESQSKMLRRRDRRLQLQVRRPLRHERRQAGRVEQLPRRRLDVAGLTTGLQGITDKVQRTTRSRRSRSRDRFLTGPHSRAPGPYHHRAGARGGR